MVGIQKMDIKNSKTKDVLDKVKTKIKLIKEELDLVNRNQTLKEQSLKVEYQLLEAAAQHART